MSVDFRAGKGQMLNKADFTEEFMNVCNDNAIGILKALGIEPQTSDGLVGQISLPEFVDKCHWWLECQAANEEMETGDLVYFTGRIATLKVECEHAIKDGFTHLCWS